MLVYWKFRSRERVDRLGQAEFQGGVANAGAIVGETFEQFLVGGGKGAGGRREDLEDPGKLNRVDQVEDGNGEDGAHAELLGKGGVNARIDLRIVGNLGFMGAQADAREAFAGVEGNAQIWSETPSGGAAHQFITAG